jgi:hypothetical protein
MALMVETEQLLNAFMFDSLAEKSA